MNTKSILYITFIAAVAFLSSCDKYLDQQPRFSLTESNGVTDYNKAKAAVNGIYSTFRNDSWAGALYVSQATKSGFINFGAAVDYNFSYTQTSNSSNGVSIWTAFYRSLNAANFAVEGINNLADNAFPSVEDKQRLLAEAKTVRAWINLNILWNYGYWWADDDSPYGLIYKDKPSSLATVNAPRISVGQSYQHIFEDLDYAITHGADFSSPRFASKQFAQVLKAKALLYRDGYRNNTSGLGEALTLVNQVLNYNNSNLAIESDLNELYNQSWDSKENLFVKYLENDGARTSAGGYWYTYGIIYQGNALPLAVNGVLTAGLRYGVDWFENDVRWPIATGAVRAPETWDDTYRYTFKKLARLGSYQGKQATPPDEKYATYYLRLAELYLLKAELLARTGASIADAIAPINELRSKRTAQGFTLLNPSTRDELNELIFKEIFLELFLENGSEFFASLRFQKDGIPWNAVIKGLQNTDITKVSWPIPDAEIVNNNNPEVKQNPGLE